MDSQSTAFVTPWFFFVEKNYILLGLPLDSQLYYSERPL
jgi:hypothetical protein